MSGVTFHYLNRKGSAGLVSKIVEKGHVLRTSSSSARICSLHFGFNSDGVKLTRIHSGSDVAVSTLGVALTNLPKRRKLIREYGFVNQKRKRPSTPVAELVEEIPSSPVLLVSPEQLESMSDDVNDDTIAELQKEVEALKAQVCSLDEALKIASSTASSVNPSSEIHFHCSFENPSHTKSWCGISNVSALWNDVSSLISLSSKQVKGFAHSGISPQGFFNKFLIWMRRGLSLRDLCGNVKKHVFSRQLKRFVDSLVPWASSYVKFPSDLDVWMSSDNGMKTSTVRKDQTIRKLYPNQVFLFVDGSYFRVSEPHLCTMSRQLFWNSKHNCHAVSFFILVAPTGRVLYSSPIYEGSIGDGEAWRAQNMEEVLEANFPPSYFTSHPDITPTVSGDKAFPRVKVPAQWKLHTTRLKASKADLKDIRCVIDPKIAPHRSVVERSIMRIKKWRVWSNEKFLSMQSLKFLSKLLLITCALTNYELFIDKGLSLI
jgi:hypothetical protein